MESISVLKSIENTKGAEVALFTTFSIDLDFTEKMVLNPLFNNGCKFASVFADDHQFEEQIQSQPEIYYLGTKYIVHPIPTHASFHPKLILLLGQETAKLIVGSGNLTASGLVSNYEYFSEFTYSKQNPEFLQIIQTAFSTCLDLFSIVENQNSLHYFQDQSLRDRFHSFPYLRQKVEAINSSNIFLTNYKKPLIEQILSNIPVAVQSIDICVPFFDQKLEAVNALAKLTGCENINIYIQDKYSNFPKNMVNQVGSWLYNPVKVFDSISSTSKSGNGKRYHGKIFRFRTTQDEYILYGSPNCSHVALLQSFQDGGNFESAVVGTGSPGQFDKYFDDLQIIGSGHQNLEVLEKLIQNTFDEFSENFKFISASIVESNLLCIFKFQLPQNIESILFGDKHGIITIDENILTISYQLEGIKLFGSLFSLDFVVESRKFQKSCWLLNVEALKKFREYEYHRPISRINMISDLEDGEFLTEIIAQCIKDMNFTISGSEQKLGTLRQRQTEQVVEVSDFNKNIDDYFVSEELEKESHHSLQKLRDSNPISYFASLFFANMFKEIRIVADGSKTIDINSENAVHSGEQKKIKLEDTVRRFINGYLNGVKSKQYLEQVSDESFLEYQVIFIKIILLMFENNFLTDLINPHYLTKVLLKLANITAFKIDFLNIDNEKQKYVISMITEAISLGVVLAEQLNEVDDANEVRKQILSIVQKLDHSGIEYRERYIEYYDFSESQILKIAPIGSMSKKKFELEMESIFGYKTWDQVYRFLKTKYHGQVKMNFTIDEVSFEIGTSKIPLKHDLVEFKMVMRTMDRFNFQKVEFNYFDLASSGIIKMKIELGKSTPFSLRTIWRKNGKCEKENIPSPLTTVEF